jgi:Zn finger protein HypA/HybF involved in hydrogenase expression
MSVLRVYDPWECTSDGVPLNWDCCRCCNRVGVVYASPEAIRRTHVPEGAPIESCSCPMCGSHGSLKAEALAKLIIERIRRGDAGENNDPLTPRCEDCGHPMNEGTWEPHPPQDRSGKTHPDANREITMALAEFWERRGVVHFSPCDEDCNHDGPGRKPFDGGWIGCNEMMNNVGITKGFQASRRPVDVRCLGWPHDLRPERLAVLCLRCWAERSSLKTE